MTPEDRRAHHEIRTLLERAAAQQAESSLSRRREVDASQLTPSERPDRDVSVHQAQRGGRPRAMAPVHECLSLRRDARNTLDARKCAYGVEREEASHGDHPCHGRRYDNGEDQNPSPDLPGP